MKKIFTTIVVLLPSFVLAQTVTQAPVTISKITDVNTLSVRIAAIGDVFLYLLVALAVVYIVWNVVHYLIRPGAEDKSKAVKDILWGILGLFIIVSIWGLVNVLVNTFSTNANVPKDRFPTANFVTSPAPTNFGM